MNKIAVLIPHYNSICSLKKTVSSIQESIKIDLFIIDDGSKNKPNLEDFTSYSYGDINLFGYAENRGIEHALNYGLDIILKKNYQYIARLDCADTCSPNRFYKQMAFLDENQDISLVGTWANILNEKDETLYVHKLPIKHQKIKKCMYLNAMFIHPTIFFRSNIIREIGNDPINFIAAEDYAFFFKVIKKYNTANIPEPLLNVQTSDTGISGSMRKKQVKTRIRIILKNFYFGFYPIYGLLRNILLLFISRKLSTSLKRILYK